MSIALRLSGLPMAAFRLQNAALFVVITVTSFSLGCVDRNIVEPTAARITLASLSAEVVPGEKTADSLARGFAIALADSDIRIGLRNALRDSPFRLHAIHLGSFLRGSDGTPIATKAAAALSVPLEEFLRMAESTPALELVMPRTLDRISWDGNAELDVAATFTSLRERTRTNRITEPGYRVGGLSTSVVTLRYSSRPFIILRPAELPFPTDAEVKRAAARMHSRNTITTTAEERASMRRNGRERVAYGKGRSGNPSIMTLDGDCDSPFAVQECPIDVGTGGGGTLVGGGGATLSPTMTHAYCYGVSSPLSGTTDRDNDGVRDSCEEALAERLAPLLNIGNDDNAPARQPYWAVSKHPDRPDNLQIIFALGYLRDDGYVHFDGHSGDSEFIVLEIANAYNSTWGVLYASLSAHFGAEEGVPPESQGGLDTYYYDDLDYPQGPYPRIWSALNKHANYRNRAACESGAAYYDSCSGDYVGTQIPAPASRNLGNFYNVPEVSRSVLTQLLDCTYWAGPSVMYGVSRTGEECFWNVSTTRFSGWDPAKPDDVTPYRRIFAIFEF